MFEMSADSPEDETLGEELRLRVKIEGEGKGRDE